jgi:predicted Zn-dependent protease
LFEQKGKKMSQVPAARKFFRSAVIVAIAATSVFGFVSTAAANNSSANPAKFEYVTIQAGQTLWDLAEQVAPNSNPQDWMQDVVNLNGLTSTDLKPGQRLALP